ncbi:AAA family ATPase [Spirosoma panaciterrae]|uniref:AAA family ATPase n=1 Tax=Spirosoma panaciterrae TaxID=496058 RepID=UPI0012FADBB3|nr:AAA family ATPase [Spirosoma panaciterrae]
MNELAREVENMPEPVPLKSVVEIGNDSGPIDYKTLGERLRIRPDEDLPPPPICLSVVRNGQAKMFGSLGNFSVIIGKAKSRKTFTISIAVAAALKRDLVLNIFSGSFDDDKRVVLYFDTEQGRYHVLKVVKRICQLADQDNPENLMVYPLRGLSANEILGFIQWHIYNTPNVGLVIIDGIKDTVTDINDNAQATKRATDLLRWSQEMDIHIITVLHMNKGNDQIRGTLGTELLNKAETVVSISLDANDKNISIVAPEVCRDKEFDSFGFSITEEGLPYLIDDITIDNTSGRTRKSTKPTADSMSQQEIIAILTRAFSSDQYLGYSSLRTNIIEASQFIGLSLAKTRAEEFIRRVEANKYLIKEKPQGKGYDAYRLNPDTITTF